MEKTKFLKFAALAIFFVLVFASAVQAVVKIQDDTKEEELVTYDIYSKGVLNKGSWEDHFNDASKIDPSPPGSGETDNYVINSGKVEIINTYPAWTDISWTKMKPITISNTGSQQSNYVLSLIVNYDADMQSDYDDLRFKHEDYPTSWLDYWIESYDTSSASVWVEIPTLPAGSSEMYMFYGNSGVSGTSNFESVFSWSNQWSDDYKITNHLAKEGTWDPDVSFNGNDRFFVAWEEGQYPLLPWTLVFKQEIRGSIFYSDDGTAVNEDFLIFTESTTEYRNENPSTVYGGSNFFVAWEQYGDADDFQTMDIKGILVSPGGTPGSDFNICTETNCQADPNVEFDSVNNHFIVVWEDARAGGSPLNYNIYGKIYDTSGNQVGSEKIISNSASVGETEPWVAYDSINEKFLIVWEEGDTPDNGPFDIYAGLFDENLNSLNTPIQLAQGTTSVDYVFPCVEFCEETETYLVTWNSADISSDDFWGNVYGAIIDSSGSLVGSTFTISSGDYVRTDIVPYLGQSFIVSYDDGNGGGSWSIWAKIVSANGDVMSTAYEFTAGGSAEADWVNLAVGDGKIFAAWEDKRWTYSYPWNSNPDVYGNMWDLNIPDDSLVSYLFGSEEDPVLSAHVTSIEIAPSDLNSWDMFSATWTDSVTFDILDGVTGAYIIQGVTPGSIQTVTADSIRLKASLSRSNPSTTPKLDYWSVSWNENNAPNTPSQPSGPTSGETGETYTYTTSTTDPDGDDVYYWFDWDDSTNSGWVGPYASGATGSATNSWSSAGTYDIKVKAKDTHDAESSYSPTLTVTIVIPNDPPYTPSNPDPYDGETGVDVDHDLSWDGGDPDSGDTVTYDIYFDDTSPPSYYATVGPYSAGQTTITYEPGTLDPNTNYYWKIIAEDNNGETSTGPEWDFTTENNPPYTPSNPDPYDGETGVDVDHDLSWTGGDPDPGDTVTYDVYFGDTNPPPLEASGLTVTTYDPDTLDYSTKYYWKIVATDNHGASTTGPIWDFTTASNAPPYTPSNPDPYDGETDVDVDYDISWNSGDPNSGDTVTYDVYFDNTSPPGFVETIGPYPASQTTITYDPGTMMSLTTYYWKIVAWDNHGASSTSIEWDFTTEYVPNNPPHTPYDPDPSNHATDIDVDYDLSWSGGDPDPYDTVTYDVYFGTSTPPPKLVSNQSTLTYDPGTMQYGTKYYWRIVAWDNNGAYASSPIWDFTTENDPPNTPSSPDPSDGETDVDVDYDISWTGGDPNPGDTVTYDVYFGDSSPPPLVASDLTVTTYDPGTMDYHTQYYWQIVAEDNHGATTNGPEWSFTTENRDPNQPSDPDPYNGETGVDVDHDLSWTCTDPDGDTLHYDIYFGDYSPPPLVESNWPSTTYDPGTMQGETIYYWKIVAKDDYGGSTEGSTWQFTTEYVENNPPYTPSSPDPADGATDVDLDADLSWTGGDPDPGDTVTYDVYFGTSSSPPQVATGLTDTTFDPGTMEVDTPYYWRIIAKDNNGATTNGPVWSFTTEGGGDNSPPYQPTIDGTNFIMGGQWYDFTFYGEDPDGDNIKYIVNWGDGQVEETAFVPSGTAELLSHLWDPQLPIFPYQITCKTEDIWGAQSQTTVHWILVINEYNQNVNVNQQQINSQTQQIQSQTTTIISLPSSPLSNN